MKLRLCIDGETLTEYISIKESECGTVIFTVPKGEEIKITGAYYNIAGTEIIISWISSK